MSTLMLKMVNINYKFIKFVVLFNDKKKDMGKAKNGIFGNVRGKVGNVIGSSWKDVYYFKSRPQKVSNPRTAKQMKQRSKFSLVQQMISATIEVIRVGFKHMQTGSTSAYNEATSYNMLNAMKETEKGHEIDYEKFMIARGDLEIANDVSVEMDGSELRFYWDTTPHGNASEHDQAILVAYNPEMKTSVYDLSAAKRRAGEGYVTIPEFWKGTTIETYLAFNRDDGSMVSDSVYTGHIEIE